MCGRLAALKAASCQRHPCKGACEVSCKLWVSLAGEQKQDQAICMVHVYERCSCLCGACKGTVPWLNWFFSGPPCPYRVCVCLLEAHAQPHCWQDQGAENRSSLPSSGPGRRNPLDPKVHQIQRPLTVQALEVLQLLDLDVKVLLLHYSVIPKGDRDDYRLRLWGCSMKDQLWHTSFYFPTINLSNMNTEIL